MGIADIILLIIVALMGIFFMYGMLRFFYAMFTDWNKAWVVIYHNPEHISKPTDIVDGKECGHSVLMTKSWALNYSEIFGDAIGIRKDKGLNKGKFIKKGTNEYSFVNFLAIQY